MQPKNDNNREHVILNEIEDGNDIPTRERIVPPAPERMTGADRGAYEDARRVFLVRLPGARRAA